jgi:RNA polymerase sigma-70 factor (ECF subfamily)
MMAAHSSSSFENMVRAHSGDLYRFAYWQCRDRFLAEDVVQETFTRAWKAWRTLESGASVKSWLYAILRHEIARLYEKKRLDIDGDQELDELRMNGQPEPSAALEMREALLALPLSYREPLLLQVLGGFTCTEIASMLSISDAAAMTRLSRARAALRKLVEPSCPRLEQVK